MLRSLYSGVAGLKSHQTRMDVIGNNIANVNTTGYKKSRVNFYDTLYQMSKGSSAPTSSRGGVNAQAVGLGTAIASIDVITTAGGTQTTNKMSDLMIQGNGYFVVQGDNSDDLYYTRAGNFDFDTAGNFINTSNGMKVLGYTFNTTTNLFSTKPEAISVAGVKSLDPKATTGLLMTGNLDSTISATDNPRVITQDIYDSLGKKHDLVLTCSRPATPDSPTITANAAASRVSWGVVSTYNQVSDYQYSLDNGVTWNDCQTGAGNFQTTLAGTTLTMQLNTNAAYADGQVQVRVKSNPAVGRSASNSASMGTMAASTGNPAPTTGITITSTGTGQQIAVTLGATAGIDDAAGCFDYSTDGGTTWTAMTTATQTLTGNFAPGSVWVRQRDTDGTTAGNQNSRYILNTSASPTPTVTTPTANVWRMDVTVDGTSYSGTGANGGLYLFFNDTGDYLGYRTLNAAGALNAAAPTATETTQYTVANIDYPIVDGSKPANGNFTIDLEGLTQYADDSTAWAGKEDPTNPDAKGYSGGSLDSYTIDKSGIITGTYSNGKTREIAQVCSAVFENPAGLKQMGQNLFKETNNSGDAQIDKVGSGSHGEVNPGTLEMSNVDLSEEFTNMITTQRGFQANSRIITTSDQMLEELLSLKR